MEILSFQIINTSDMNILCTVTAAWHEPEPGWVDNISGATGFIMEIGRGNIRSLIGDQKLTADLIPVDFVVNALIGVAWHTATTRYIGNNYNLFGSMTTYLHCNSNFLRSIPGTSILGQFVMHSVVEVKIEITYIWRLYPSVNL
jgi:hypothetical protein